MPPRSRLIRPGIKYSRPTRIFFWTLDQVASMFSVDEDVFRTKWVYYVDRSSGPPGDKLLAHNIAVDSETPQWRIEDGDLVRYLRRKGLVWYEVGRYEARDPE